MEELFPEYILETIYKVYFLKSNNEFINLLLELVLLVLLPLAGDEGRRYQSARDYC